jgi:3-oxoacyl-(acyl-carrier-protein) synthase
LGERRDVATLFCSRHGEVARAVELLTDLARDDALSPTRYEATRGGKQRAMVAGGTEELCATEAAVFDTLFATSVKNDAPGTQQGDIAESHPTAQVFGAPPPPISSLKSYMGHTLDACGALEAWISIEMMREGWFARTINLDQIDPQCPQLDYIMGEGRQLECEYVMSNNFAFGGINTSLIFKRYR